ncbi:hypothetical protein [Streptomyces sp. 7N604]|uniref:hypothetical protein n=1 Tax=Streptomyces sp. 7N604 TaxID=3457415 RepID=UPI003FD3E115
MGRGLGGVPQVHGLGLGRGQQLLRPRAQGLVRLRRQRHDLVAQLPRLLLHLLDDEGEPRRALPRLVTGCRKPADDAVDLLGPVTAVAAAYRSETVR